MFTDRITRSTIRSYKAGYHYVGAPFWIRPIRTVALRLVSTSTGDESLFRFQSLAERDAGDAPDRSLYETIPPHLERPLAWWLRGALADKQDVAQTVLLRCRLDVNWWGTDGYSIALQKAITGGPLPADCPNQQLDLLNAFIALHDGWPSEFDTAWTKSEDEQRNESTWFVQRYQLERLLTDAGSAWTIDDEFQGLYRRVDPTVVEARKTAEAAAREAGRPTAAEHLRAAWQEAYGVSPDPTRAYGEAVKAVEASAIPVVSPANSRATLGTVIRDMRTQEWRLVLVDTKDAPTLATALVDLVDKLWQGQRSRHGDGGSGTARDQTQSEAEAALHLAALAVQWFSSGAITKTANS